MANVELGNLGLYGGAAPGDAEIAFAHGDGAEREGYDLRVDELVFGTSPRKPSAVTVAVSNVDLATSAANGASISGWTLSTGEVFWAVAQTTGSENGPWEVQASGRPVRPRWAALQGTAQAGSSTTITLASDVDSPDDTFNGRTIAIVAGTGAGQSKTVTDYVGSTKVATVNSAWGTTPDATSVYSIGSSLALVSGDTFTVQKNGSHFAGTTWGLVTTGTITVDTTAQAWHCINTLKFPLIQPSLSANANSVEPWPLVNKNDAGGNITLDTTGSNINEYVVPFMWISNFQPDRLVTRVKIGVASSDYSVALYEHDIANGRPGDRLFRADSISSVTSNTTNVTTLTGFSPLLQQWYWAVFASDSASNLRAAEYAIQPTLVNGAAQGTSLYISESTTIGGTLDDPFSSTAFSHRVSAFVPWFAFGLA